MSRSLDELDHESQRGNKKLNVPGTICDGWLRRGRRDGSEVAQGSTGLLNVIDQVRDMAQDIFAGSKRTCNRTVLSEWGYQLITGAVIGDAELNVNAYSGIEKTFCPPFDLEGLS